MRNFKRIVACGLMALFVLPAALAFENDSTDWPSKPAPPRRRGPIDPLEFARITATGNDSTPRFAEERDAALISAAEQNDLLGVETLLKNGANANARDALGNRPLLHAARLGAAEMVRLLLEEGADPNVKGMGFTPLGLAALHGYPQVAEWLLKSDAYVYLRSDNGLTPLMNAALLNHVSVMQVILRHDTEIDRVNNAGRTALSYAAEGGAEQAIELLLARGADVNAVDKKFNAPLFWAALRERRGAIRLLLRHGAETGAVSLDLL